MATITLSFQFQQRFPFPARDVYAWATTYDPADIERLGKHGHREAQHINQDTILLQDTIRAADGSGVTKPKIVRLYPKDLRWVNTHVGGPNQYSQFIYELKPAGKNACVLTFTGAQLIHDSNATPAEVRKMSAAVKKEDAAMWKNLVKVMTAELKAAEKPRKKR